MTELEAIIHAEILTMGSIRFDRFMDLALYCPSRGYYRRPRERSRTGREGDFFTSVSVGPLFGCLLARQFFQMWQRMESPRPFWMIEQGADRAQLTCDILKWCRDETPAFFEAIRYAVIEPDSSMEKIQRKYVEEAGFPKQVEWFRDWDVHALSDRQPVGVFFSNELVDAFPVRAIICRAGKWRELQVTLGDKTAFAWIEKPIEDRELAEAIKTLAPPSIEGYTTEINLRARDWMNDVGRVLKRGYVLTIDYGFPASVYYAPFRVNGTLTAYLNHRRMEEVLLDPGERDITAHVDFTALARAGEVAGLTTLALVDQQRFLMGIAKDELAGTPGPRAGIEENVRAWHTLTHPAYLGARFHALLQAKDAPANLDCLQFSRPGGLD